MVKLSVNYVGKSVQVIDIYGNNLIGFVNSITRAEDNDPEITSLEFTSTDGHPYLIFENEINSIKLFD